MCKSLILLCIYAFVMSGCGRKAEQDSNENPRANDLAAKYVAKLDDAKHKASPDGWLTPNDCDGMLWAAKYSCGGGSVKITASEYADEPGRFNRRPLPFCGVENKTSDTTWSRDMGMGLISAAWCRQDLDVLKRHATYGIAKNWQMGQPLADGRAVYTPSLIGILYQVIYSLHGEDSPNRAWPSIYSPGLDDYQAHLQMLDVWLRGEMASEADKPRKPAEGEALTLDISNTMYMRIKEHSDREPDCPFYQYLRGVYDGSMDRPLDLLLASDKPSCSYARGESLDNVLLAEWLFSAKLVLKKLKIIND